MNASPKLLVVAALAMILVYAGVASVRDGQRGRSERMYESTRRSGSRLDEPKTLAAWEVASAYTLRFEPLLELGERRFSPEMGDALARELAERMGDVELVNVSEYDEPPTGGFGEVIVRYGVEDQSYSGSGSTSHQGSSLPGSVWVEMDVTSSRGTCSWDGLQRAEATIDLPSSIRMGAAYGMYEEYAGKLAERVVDALPHGSEFSRR